MLGKSQDSFSDGGGKITGNAIKVPLRHKSEQLSPESIHSGMVSTAAGDQSIQVETTRGEI